MTTTILRQTARPVVNHLDLPDAAFTLSADRVDLWLVRRPTGADAEALALAELDAQEREHTDSFIRRSDGLLYAAAHVAVRRLLGRYTRTLPRDVRFMREPCPGCGEPHGRPAVAPPPPPLHYSLSHSGGVALVGVGTVPLGVDLEKLPGAETVDICSKALHPDEQSEIAEAAAGEARRQLFGEIWTRKEAFLKGLGTGLSRSPAEDYLGTDHDRHPDDWTMVGIPADTSHAAAIAVAGTATAVVDVRWVPDSWLSVAGVVCGASAPWPDRTPPAG
ncbi:MULTISPECIES: 4'-phosphopantetheinyl transferase superfamily protein [unclassified Streptomyces]|uniref:4'-phosphopantetheinyl transferase family protein n=1 Tax=unclassified Streptomyces TaxID=2593676 RepID=UPI00109EDBC7|nr:4'-phosphopantetheinyl transferase superfamily protein [Streptomyces sp. A1136]THA54653.1 4'-phosphopantetheinyl transferase superfamily protein [Streptomyces sp. A1136]